MHWVVLANSNLYRIYLFKRKPRELSLLKEEFHPNSKAKKNELMADQPGRYQYKTPHQARGSYSWHTDPKKNEIDHFLKDLAENIEKGRLTNQYENLILIAPARVSGAIIKHLDKNTEPLLFNNIQKDYTHFVQHELDKFLHEEWLNLIAEKV